VKRPKKRKQKLPTAAELRVQFPNRRAVDALEGVLDAVESEVPAGLEPYAPMMRAGMALLLGIGSQGGKSFGVDTGDGVTVLVRPADTQAVAMRAVGVLVEKIATQSTRERAKAAFKKKLAKSRSKA
jgi:hypothetical protein